MNAHRSVWWAMTIAIVALHAGPVAMRAGGSFGAIAVRVEGFRNTTGTARISLFNRATGFPDNEAAALRRSVTEIGDGWAEVRFDDLPFGDYAVAVHHDENSDAKMNRRMFGIPKEGYGVSNNVIPARRAPTFEEARLALNTVSRTVVIRVHY